MKNLAGQQDCDTYIGRELRRCGIDAVHIKRTNTEVPYSIIGKLGDMIFTRGWYYWVVEGKVPLTIAQELYADPVGKEDVRVAGHCGCPPPEGVWVTYLDDNEKELVSPSQVPDDAELVRVVERLNKFRVVDDPSTEGRPFIMTYHIDSEVGLRLFADTLKRHGLDVPTSGI